MSDRNRRHHVSPGGGATSSASDDSYASTPGRRSGNNSASFNSSYRSNSDAGEDSLDEDIMNETDEAENRSPGYAELRRELRRRKGRAGSGTSPGRGEEDPPRGSGTSPRSTRRSPRSPAENAAGASPSPLKRGIADVRGELPRRPLHSGKPRSPIKWNERKKSSTNQEAAFGLDAARICAICFVLTVILVVLVLKFNPLRSRPLVLMSQTPEDDRARAREIVLQNLAGEFETLRGMFAQQERRFWGVVMAAIKRVAMDEYPVQPAVILLVSTDDKGTGDILNCLASHITDAVMRAHNSSSSNAFKINLKDMTRAGKSPDALKLELDELLSNSFGAGNKAGLLYNIQDLPARTAMLFHSYCDNANAPFKDITLTFTLQMDAAGISGGATGTRSDEEIEEKFHQIWGGDLDKDTLSPLLSRIANSIAVVKPETMETMTTHCKA